MAEIPHGRPAKKKSLHRLTNQLVMAPHSINSRLVNSKNHCSCFLDIKVAYDVSQKTSFNMHSPHLVTVDWCVLLRDFYSDNFCTIFCCFAHSASFKVYFCFTEEKKKNDWWEFQSKLLWFMVKLNARVTGVTQSVSLMCKWKWLKTDWRWTAAEKSWQGFYAHEIHVSMKPWYFFSISTILFCF